MKNKKLYETFESFGNVRYEVEYYYRVGEHASHQMPTFDAAIKEAEEIRSGVLAAGEGDDTEYVGVASSDPANEEFKFAVVYVTEWYLNNRVARIDFYDKSSYDSWIEAAQKCLETGNTQISYYK